MQDPVSGFDYPVSWVERCNNPGLLELVDKGLAILTADGEVRKRGFTTGTTAAAAAKAAVLSLAGDDIREVTILTPSNIRIHIPVFAENGTGRCKKYSGDYPGDVTAGLEFVAQASPSVSSSETKLTFGPGIGIWDRDIPRYKKGEPAVSFQVMDEIRTAINEAIAEIGISEISVMIYAPNGVEVAEKTLNRKVGVVEGISVLGTTGFVEPWDDHLEQTVCERAAGAERVVLTTGRIGMRYARMLFPDHEVILAGSRLGTIIPHLTGRIIICGLPALVLKYVNPRFLENTGYPTVEEMTGSEFFIPAMHAAFEMYKTQHPDIRIVIVNREGEIIGDSE
ncbi:cobalt-precorrin-5B (C(1))-methyltransferase [Methanospirillum stamsii]|uniref:Cobalt-precorrin-5B C(1)-methyltransferase n=1 Tax=Methanospirillum stamsii TaxID=1277351 RepID=A0A2V2N990_9EURY|nr:cobalt-precorrin-5B (C(1))-methyltransferase [Methanospirillum stamsii]PWR75135.1 cobalt-precorrin-5B (C(1))-methyltransferase [Methanospirillum stamsii]